MLPERLPSIFKIAYIFTMPYDLHGVYFTETYLYCGAVNECRCMQIRFLPHFLSKNIFIRHSVITPSVVLTQADTKVMSNTS